MIVPVLELISSVQLYLLKLGVIGHYIFYVRSSRNEIIGFCGIFISILNGDFEFGANLMRLTSQGMCSVKKCHRHSLLSL